MRLLRPGCPGRDLPAGAAKNTPFLARSAQRCPQAAEQLSKARLPGAEMLVSQGVARTQVPLASVLMVSTESRESPSDLANVLPYQGPAKFVARLSSS